MRPGPVLAASPPRIIAIDSLPQQACWHTLTQNFKWALPTIARGSSAKSVLDRSGSGDEGLFDTASK
jgi:hypothetical protein